MAWFKVDDKLHDHRKARSAGTAAMGVWLLAGSWAADNLTDGFIPATILPRWGRPRDASRLCDVGLWHADEQDGEKGWRFHEWAERQPTRAQKLAERAIKAEAGRVGGLHSGRSRREASAKQAATGQVELPSRPDPTPIKREVADQSKASGRKRPSTSFPEDFEPNDTNRALAAERNLDLDAVVANFKDWNLAKDGRYADWQRALSTWLRREKAQPAARPAAPRLPHASELEQPPDGLSVDEYAKWDYEQRQKRGTV